MNHNIHYTLLQDETIHKIELSSLGSGSDQVWNRSLGSVPGVRLFAPQYSTRQGRVLSQLLYLPLSKTILIWSSSYDKKLKNSVALENLMLYQTHIQNISVYGSLCQWCDCFLVEFYDYPRLAWPVIKIYLIPDTRPELNFSYSFDPWLLLVKSTN